MALDCSELAELAGLKKRRDEILTAMVLAGMSAIATGGEPAIIETTSTTASATDFETAIDPTCIETTVETNIEPPVGTTPQSTVETTVESAVESTVLTTVESTIDSTSATAFKSPIDSTDKSTVINTIASLDDTKNPSVEKDGVQSDNEHLKEGLQSDNEQSCNRRVLIDALSQKTRRCGQKPVVLKYTKQKYCERHKNEHVAWKKARYQNDVVHKKGKGNKTVDTDEGYPSMSMLCSLSHDGFYLDILRGSHKISFLDKKGEDKIHFSEMEQIYIPQTYMVLFHKWLYHSGSACLQNKKKEHCQERLFAYLVTDSESKKRKKTLSSDRSYPVYVNTDKNLFCKGREEKEWMCTECDHDKFNKQEEQKKECPFSPPPKTWDRTTPGKIVDGNLERDGYIIVRTSIVKEECDFLLQLDEYLVKGESKSGWDNICNRGGQSAIDGGKRQQFALDHLKTKTAKKGKVKMKGEVNQAVNQKGAVEKLFNYTFDKLLKDILKVNPAFEKKGKWTQRFEHRKVLRNVGSCRQQYPHTDYAYDPKPKETDADKVKAKIKKGKS